MNAIDMHVPSALEVRLFQAVSKGDMEAARQALDDGAAVVSPNGFTPLSLAALRLDTDIAALLLERGANVRTCTRSTGETPLHLAAGLMPFGPNMKMVELLLRAGADTEARDVWGKRPIDSAIRAVETGLPDLDELMAVHRAHRGIDGDLARKMAALRNPVLLGLMALFRAHEQAQSLAVAIDAQARPATPTPTRARM